MVLGLGKVFSGSALHHSSSYYGTGTQQNVILSTPMKGFFEVFFFWCARHPADFDGCPTTGAKALASVSLIPWHPCHSRPALHRRVPFLRFEHSISLSTRHFLVVLHIETRVTRFRWRSVCLSVVFESRNPCCCHPFLSTLGMQLAPFKSSAVLLWNCCCGVAFWHWRLCHEHCWRFMLSSAFRVPWHCRETTTVPLRRFGPFSPPVRSQFRLSCH